MGFGEDILVIKNSILFDKEQFEGFRPIKEKDYTSIILKNHEYKKRTLELEGDINWQQPIPYVWIINPEEKKVFIYKRSQKGAEGRLHDKISGGVGGHIDKNTEENSKNPITDAMTRELKEEVLIKTYPIPEIIGFINFNCKSGKVTVEDVHFGIVAIAETREEVIPAEDMTEGKFYSLEEAENLLTNPKIDIEPWTKTSWPFVKKYILNK